MKKIGYGIIGLLLLSIVYLWYVHASVYWKLGASGLWQPADFKSTIVGEQTDKKLTYVALGDSLTAGVGVDTYTKSYPYLVAQDIARDRHVQVDLEPFAMPGVRSFYVLSHFVDTAVAVKPDIVTLLIGVNDIHGNIPPASFKENYEAILSTLTQKTKADIYVINLPYIGTRDLIKEPFASYLHWRVSQYNVIIAALAAKYHVTYIDLYSAHEPFSLNTTYYATDSFHPNAMGYTLWAKTIYANIGH